MTLQIKEKQVQDLAGRIKRARTLMIVSVNSLPSKQFQDIKKVIRNEAYVKIAKKNIIMRALQQLGKDSLTNLESHIHADIALVLSDKEGYELARILNQKKTPAYAKAGQIAPDDIIVKAGPTNLVPGPAISELGAVGIQISIENGKISIKADKMVLQGGKEIKGNVASLLQKLDIKPFSVVLIPLVIYDTQSEQLYTHISIDPQGATNALAMSAGKALGFAQKIEYYCRETIGYFLAKANAQGVALSKSAKAKGSSAQLNP